MLVPSFKDLEYRNYVLKQLRMKKVQIENIIRKQQERIREQQEKLREQQEELREQQEQLTVLEATMENIMDGKCGGGEQNKKIRKSNIYPHILIM